MRMINNDEVSFQHRTKNLLDSLIVVTSTPQSLISRHWKLFERCVHLASKALLKYIYPWIDNTFDINNNMCWCVWVCVRLLRNLMCKWLLFKTTYFFPQSFRESSLCHHVRWTSLCSSNVFTYYHTLKSNNYEVVYFYSFYNFKESMFYKR